MEIQCLSWTGHISRAQWSHLVCGYCLGWCSSRPRPSSRTVCRPEPLPQGLCPPGGRTGRSEAQSRRRGRDSGHRRGSALQRDKSPAAQGFEATSLRHRSVTLHSSPRPRCLALRNLFSHGPTCLLLPIARKPPLPSWGGLGLPLGLVPSWGVGPWISLLSSPGWALQPLPTWAASADCL